MYSNPVLEHFLHPRHVGNLPCPDGVGTVGTFGDGNFIRMGIAVVGGRITQVQYKCFTCPVGVAACDMTAQLAQDLTLAKALSLSAEDIAQALGGVPPEKMSRCHWAIAALRAAVDDFCSRSTISTR